MTAIDELIERLRCMPCQSVHHSKLILDAIDILKDYDNLVVANEMLENMLEVASSKSQVQHGEWVGMDGDQCSVCKRYVSEIMDADSYYAIGFEPSTLVACPYCGAKMDGGND